MTIWQRLSYAPPSSEHIYYLQLNGESNFINSHDCPDFKIIQMLKYLQIMCSINFMFCLKVEGVFYINDLLEKLMFDELKHFAGTQGNPSHLF